jgi:hypothetical protein
MVPAGRSGGVPGGWCGYARVASELLEVCPDARPLPAQGVALEPSVGDHLGVVHPGPASLRKLWQAR